MNSLTNDQLQAFTKELLTSYDDWTLEQVSAKLEDTGITGEKVKK